MMGAEPTRSFQECSSLRKRRDLFRLIARALKKTKPVLPIIINYRPQQLFRHSHYSTNKHNSFAFDLFVGANRRERGALGYSSGL